MHDLAEAMEKTKPIKELKEKLIDCLKSNISSKGLECINTEEAGEVVDMIKDFTEAERNCMEALYYQKVTEAMASYEEPRYGESANYGYNPNRYPSSGRYAPKGDGTRMGFLPHTPYLHYEDRRMDPQDYMNEVMMGYSDSKKLDSDPRYGRAYNDYRTTRRHYTETHSPEDRHEMNEHAEKHVKDSITTIREIWEDADPALKRRMKEDFTKLVNEMNV